MGPTALFDKSFLQGLSLDESVFFDQFFTTIVCPVFFVETLADLEKAVRDGSTPEHEVGAIADKVPEMYSAPNLSHVGLAIENLLGNTVPMDGRMLLAGGRPATLDGSTGTVFQPTPEAQAFERWQNREFIQVERRFARNWREALNAVDLVTVAAGMRAMGIYGKSCRTLGQAKAIVDGFLTSTENVPDQIKLAVLILGAPSGLEARAIERWHQLGQIPLSASAPYAAHVMAVEIFFQIALAANLISAERKSNRTDIAYLFYLPFCQVFVSSDRLHERCAPHFLRPDQTFVWGHELKASLHQLVTRYQALPQAEKERGLMSFAGTPPPEDREGLVGRLWDRHLHPWRERPQIDVSPALRAALEGLKSRIRTVLRGPRPSHPTTASDPGFVVVNRLCRSQKGSWWQVPKNVDGQDDGA